MISTNVKFLMTVILVLSVNVYSQDDSEKKLGWFFEGKLAGLWAGGNSDHLQLD